MNECEQNAKAVLEKHRPAYSKDGKIRGFSVYAKGHISKQIGELWDALDDALNEHAHLEEEIVALKRESIVDALLTVEEQDANTS